jgi:hypothetical protein
MSSILDGVTDESALVPHFKCVACRTRLSSAAAPAEMVGDLCPSCGNLLEPVGSLVEVIGFRRISPRVALPKGDSDIAQAAALPRPGTRG